MRNLKKILALALALVMTLSLMTVANAFNDDKDIDAKYDEAVTVLSDLKVFKGVNDGSNFAPKQTITRAEVAAIIYRIVTGDVNDTQAGIYKDYAKFKDVAQNHWAAGYIGYCSNAELIVGDGTNFYPDQTVNGYQALAMILRAMGYDQNDEFKGEGWEIRVASTAQQKGVLKNVNAGTLGVAATRELVAELLFQAISGTNTVFYLTNTMSYMDEGSTLGYQTFGLAKGNRTTIDNWGRPGYTWTATKNSLKMPTVATVEEAPAATYTAKVAECDVAHDAGVNTNKTYLTYINGTTNTGSYVIHPLNTATYIGAQGRLTEVYSDRIVMIDTFLAQVESVKDATYDAQGHLRTPATITLNVYDGNTVSSALVTDDYVLTNGAVNYTYTAGQWVLLNAYTETAGTTVTSSVNVAKSGNNGVYGEIVGTASTLTGAQTVIWYNASQHTVNGTVYNDAAKFYLDQAGNDITNHTWFFDSYGNLIGAVDIAAQYNYGAIKNIWWSGNPATGAGSAMATVVYMDGSENTVTLGSMTVNGNTTGVPTYSIVNSDIMTVANGKFYVTTSAATNAYYDDVNNQNVTNVNGKNGIIGGHLFRFETLANGTVAASEVVTSTTAKVDKGVSTIAYGVYVNSETQFLVKNGNGTFSAITGYTNIGSYNSAEVDYVNLDADQYAEYVYIIGAPADLNSSSLFYLTSTQVQYILVNGTQVVDHYILTGFVDGVMGTIKVKPAEYSSVVTPMLTAGANTMFVVKTENGFVKSIQYTVATDNWDLDAMNPANSAYAGMQVFGIIGDAGDSWNGDVYTDGTNRFNVAGVTPLLGNWDTDMSGKNVVLVYRDNMTVVAAYIVDKSEAQTPQPGNKVQALGSGWTHTVNGVQASAPTCYTGINGGTPNDALQAALANPVYLSLSQYGAQAGGAPYSVVASGLTNGAVKVFPNASSVGTVSGGNGTTSVTFSGSLAVGNVIVVGDTSVANTTAAYYTVFVVTA